MWGNQPRQAVWTDHLSARQGHLLGSTINDYIRATEVNLACPRQTKTLLVRTFIRMGQAVTSTNTNRSYAHTQKRWSGIVSPLATYLECTWRMTYQTWLQHLMKGGGRQEETSWLLGPTPVLPTGASCCPEGSPCHLNHKFQFWAFFPSRPCHPLELKWDHNHELPSPSQHPPFFSPLFWQLGSVCNRITGPD